MQPGLAASSRPTTTSSPTSSGDSPPRRTRTSPCEGPEGIVFLHRIVPGATDRSYGVHVARLAGVPEGVLEEAERLLRRLETESSVPGPSSARRRRGPRYTQAVLLPEGTSEHPVIEELRSLEPDQLAPEEAAKKLRELKARAGSSPDPKTEESP